MFTDFENAPVDNTGRLIRPGDVVRVMLPAWGVWHYGIVYSVDLAWQGNWFVTIIDNSKERGHVGFTSLEAFSGVNPFVHVHRPADEWEAPAILQRAVSRLNAPYHLTAFNCETFVTWVLSGTEKSDHVAKGTLLALAVVAGAALTWATTNSSR
jgi:hypothetical protein